MKTSAQRGSQACGWSRVIGSFCGRARSALFAVRREACSKLRKCVVSWSEHLWSSRAAFSCARGGPPCPDAAPDLPQSWERAHYFVVVRHYDCKNGPAKLFNHLSATKLRRRAPPVLRDQEGLDKDGAWRGWLVPCRTLALELSPQSIGRSPRLHSARQSRVQPARSPQLSAKLHWHSAA